MLHKHSMISKVPTYSFERMALIEITNANTNYDYWPCSEVGTLFKIEINCIWK